jgi:hypothetical protein
LSPQTLLMTETTCAISLAASLALSASAASPTVRTRRVYDLVTMVIVAHPWVLIVYAAVLGGLGWLGLRGIARFHRWLHRRP